MTAGILSGMSVVEGSAFVAAPLCGMTLAQLGADVIRYEVSEGPTRRHHRGVPVRNSDGTSEVDYTVNVAMGFPEITGPRGTVEPVNSVLPAWDIVMSEMAAVGLLAAERHRGRAGDGWLVKLALSDIAMAMVGNLGRLAQAQLGGKAGKEGNYLYGAFGHDFGTADGRRVMVVALTERQWRALREATGLDAAALASATGADLDTEGGRYTLRDAIRAELVPWFAARPHAKVRRILAAADVSWGPYQTFAQLIAEDPRCSPSNPMFTSVEHIGIGLLLTPASPLDFSSVERVAAKRAPVPGEHTDEILTEMGLGGGEIGKLHDRGIVAGPATS